VTLQYSRILKQNLIYYSENANQLNASNIKILENNISMFSFYKFISFQTQIWIALMSIDRVTKLAEPQYGRPSLVTKLNPPREATSVDC
jgi:hypothetical protein